MAKIVLVSMVRNECAVITRLLDSVKGVVDGVSVLDTGSTDGTQERVLDWGAENGVLTNLHRSAFVDFSTSRNEAMSRAQNSSVMWGFQLADTYALLLDADMVLSATAFSPTDLTAPCYSLLQQNNSMEYWNLRLTRLDNPGVYLGRTHEYLSVREAAVKLTSLSIKDVGDGGCKADKYQRDERLLRMDLRDNPKNYRAMFYLAQTLENLKKPEAARVWYARRRESTEFKEEHWISGYYGARCEDTAEKKIAKFGEAFVERPWRAEPLVAAAREYLAMEKYQEAFTLARIAMKLPRPEKDVLFVEPAAYSAAPLEIIALSGYYVGGEAKEMGQIACDKLTLMSGRYQRTGLSNLRWYIPRLPGSLVGTFVLEGWNACNPSIVRTSDGYLVNVRGVNYELDDYGRCHYDGTVRTSNTFIELNKELTETSRVMLQAPEQEEGIKIQGLEDLRIRCAERDHVTVSGTLNTPDGLRIAEAVFFRDTGRLQKIRVIPGQCTEKNWLPVNDGWLYRTLPLTLVTSEGHRTALHKHQEVDLRGSAGLVPFDHGHLWVVHQVSQDAKGKRIYYHRFCYSDEGFEQLKVGPAFCFEKPQIEFCSGLCWMHGKDSVLLTYGVDDHEAKVVELPANVIRSMF